MANDERRIFMRLTEYQAGWWSSHLEGEIELWCTRMRQESDPEDKSEAAHVLAQLSLVLASVQNGVAEMRERT
jgi:hypothetical protein